MPSMIRVLDSDRDTTDVPYAVLDIPFTDDMMSLYSTITIDDSGGLVYDVNTVSNEGVNRSFRGIATPERLSRYAHAIMKVVRQYEERENPL
jgi:hypothetical protein